MDALIDKMDKSEKAKIDQSVARFLFTTNTPSHRAESKSFKNMTRKLRPSYVPPTRKTVYGKLSSNEYKEVCPVYLKQLTISIVLK